MSVREDDQKTACPGRGLGIAAAAIGVGVGAALYYFFSKSPENPDTEGATTSGWTTENNVPLRPGFEENQLSALREKAFRERSYTLEECSICFDVMLCNEELLTLPCTHSFHIKCIGPWLQEKRTCPNCRKNA